MFRQHTVMMTIQTAFTLSNHNFGATALHGIAVLAHRRWITAISCMFVCLSTRFLHAQWTVTSIHSSSVADSFAFATFDGKQVGYVGTGGIYHATLWSSAGATWVDLSGPEIIYSDARGLDAYQQVGTTAIGGYAHASLWAGAATSWVDLHPNGATLSSAEKVKNGRHVGFAQFGGIDHAGMWTGTAASWVDLSPPGTTGSRAYGIDAGQQVGYAILENRAHASLWTGSAASWVDLDPPGAIESIAFSVSNGQQAGYAGMPGDYSHAGIWASSAGSFVDLHPATAQTSRAYATFSGRQVGQVLIGGTYRAAFWAGSAASFEDLSLTLSGNWIDTVATGIWNDATTIFVTGYGRSLDSGRYVALLWSRPIPVSCQPPWQGAIGTIGLNGNVLALATFPNGDVIAGGDFTMAGGTFASHIARWDGVQWFPLYAGLNDTVRALAVLPDGDLIAGGNFTTSDGAYPLNHIARYHNNIWYPMSAEGIDGVVTALTTLPNGDVIAGGNFYHAGDIAANSIARWSVYRWLPMGSGIGEDEGITALTTLHNGDVIAGGGFLSAGGVFANGISRWNGTEWSSLGSAPNVTALTTLPNGDLVVSGGFAFAGGVAANQVARWDGTSWSPLGSGLDSPALCLAALPDGDLIAAGPFSVAGGVAAPRIARWSNSEWVPLSGSTDNLVRAITPLPDGNLIVGGEFNTAGGTTANHVARYAFHTMPLAITTQPIPVVLGPCDIADFYIAASGVGPLNYLWQMQGLSASAPTAWTNLTDGPVLSNGEVIGTASGASLSSFGYRPSVPEGHPVRCVVSNACGSITSDAVDLTFHIATSLGAGTNGPVLALAKTANGDVIAGGDFTAAGGISANNVARWNGSEWSSLGSGTNGPVWTLAVLQNGDIIAGGQFSSAGSVPASNIARWNGVAWLPLGMGTSDRVRALLVTNNGDVIAGGDFLFAGNFTVNFIARWNGMDWSALPQGGPNGTVTCLTKNLGGEVIAGGYFLNRGNVLRLANGVAWAFVGGGTDDVVWSALTLANGDLVVGGQFMAAGSGPANHIARKSGSQVFFPLSSGLGGVPFSLAELPNGNILAGQTADFGNVVLSHLARWNGSVWSAFGQGTDSSVNALLTMPNGDVIVGGDFVTAGGIAANYIARITFGAAPPIITTQPVSSSTCPHGTATFAIAASAADALSFQWQLLELGPNPPGTWSNISDGPIISNGQQVGTALGTTSPHLTYTTHTLSGHPCRCIVSNVCGSITSDTAFLTVCVADADDGTATGFCDGGVTIDDLLFYLFIFEAGDLRSDVDDGSGMGTPDDGVTIDDLLYYLSRFEAGC